MNFVRTMSAGLLLACTLLSSSPAQAGEIFPVPSDANVVNVTNWSSNPAFNANGNDQNDDTAAIQAAIHHAQDTSNRYAFPRMVYIPNGTYYINNSIEWRGRDKTGWSSGWLSNGLIIGQSRTGTILKVRDNTPGFNNASFPRYVLATGTENGGANGGGNAQAFHHYIRNLTVDCGNNPGAIGIEFLTSNRGAVKDVLIKGNGRVGIQMLRDWPGPGLVKNVTIEGFRIGIDTGGTRTNDQGVPVGANGLPLANPNNTSQWQSYGPGQYGMTFEDITLNNQSVVGMQCRNNMVSVRRLTSNNRVPGFWAWGGCYVTIIDSVFNRLAGADQNKGVIWRDSNPMFLRNVRSTGSNIVLDNFYNWPVDILGGSGTSTIEEWTSDRPRSLFPESTSLRSLNLPVEETPEFVYPTLANGQINFSQCTSVTTARRVNGIMVKAIPNDGQDDTAAIQGAIDSGKTVIYFPNGNINQSLIIRNNAQLLIGFTAQVLAPAGLPVFRFQRTGTTFLEHITANVRHESTGTLVIKHCSGDFLTSTNNQGKTFLEDVVLYPRVYSATSGTRHRFWGRQVNSEIGNTSLADIVNSGGEMWIFGFKTEYPSRSVDSLNGNTELFGGFIYPHAANPASVPSLRVMNGRLSAACVFNPTYSYGDGMGGTITEGFTHHVSETRDGVTRTSGSYGNGTALYVSGGTISPLLANHSFDAQNFDAQGTAISGWLNTVYNGTSPNVLRTTQYGGAYLGARYGYHGTLNPNTATGYDIWTYQRLTIPATGTYRLRAQAGRLDAGTGDLAKMRIVVPATGQYAEVDLTANNWASEETALNLSAGTVVEVGFYSRSVSGRQFVFFDFVEFFRQ